MYRKKNQEIQVEEVKICEEVEGLYSDKGRPGIGSVSLFKIVFIQYLFGIRSMRRTIIEVHTTNREGYREYKIFSCLNLKKLAKKMFRDFIFFSSFVAFEENQRQSPSQAIPKRVLSAS